MPKNAKSALQEAIKNDFSFCNVKLVKDTNNIFDATNFSEKNILRYDIQLTNTAVLSLQYTQGHFFNVRLAENICVLYRVCFKDLPYVNTITYLQRIAEIIQDCTYLGMDINLFHQELEKLITICSYWWAKYK